MIQRNEKALSETKDEIFRLFHHFYQIKIKVLFTIGFYPIYVQHLLDTEFSMNFCQIFLDAGTFL